MAYNWTNGELITAEKLNSTGGGGVLEIQLEEDGTLETMNKTWNEINTAFCAGKVCFVLWPESYGDTRDMVVGVSGRENLGTYTVTVVYPNGGYEFSCSSPDGYPYYSFD